MGSTEPTPIGPRAMGVLERGRPVRAVSGEIPSPLAARPRAQGTLDRLSQPVGAVVCLLMHLICEVKAKHLEKFHLGLFGSRGL
jgi:hypothetical protein